MTPARRASWHREARRARARNLQDAIRVKALEGKNEHEQKHFFDTLEEELLFEWEVREVRKARWRAAWDELRAILPRRGD